MKRIWPVLAAVLAVFAGVEASVPAPRAFAAPQEEKPKDDPRLVAIGGLGASALYLSYLVIGSTADGFGKEAYDAARVQSIADSVSALLKTNSEQLAAVRKTPLTEEDGKSVDEILAVMGMLREYAKLLVDYTKEKDPKVAEAFQDHRKKTWERIKNLLGIK